MAINILFDVFITNEYGNETKVTELVNGYKETRKIGMLYNVCEFTLGNFDLPMSYSQDGVIRIRVERVIDGVNFSDLYLIDNMVKVNKQKNKIIGKTAGVLLLEPYLFPSTETFNYSTYNELFNALASPLEVVANIPPIPNSTRYYDVTNVTRGRALLAITAKLGIDISFRGGKLVLELFKRIMPNSKAVLSFDQVDSTKISSSNKKSTGVGIFVINESTADLISKATLSIQGTTPQPVRPSTRRTWIDPASGDEYNIVPTTGIIELLYSPIREAQVELRGYPLRYRPNYFLVEEFNVVDENSITLKGGVSCIMNILYYDRAYYTGGDFETPAVSSAHYSHGVDSDMIAISAIPSGNLVDGDGIQFSVVESGGDQAISSSLTGTGSDADPYIYIVSLGNQENVSAEYSTMTMTIKSMYSYSEIIETLHLQSNAKEDVLNGHIIKIDGTGNVETSGHSYSAVETIFYIDPSERYGSVAEVIFQEIMDATDLPYTASEGTINSKVVLTPNRTVLVAGTFSGGSTESYAGQRDNKALSEFIRLDANVSGILTASASSDTSNPTTIPSVITTQGGSGTAQCLVSTSFDAKFEKNHNIVYFNQPVVATVRIAYLTDAYVAHMPNMGVERKIFVKAKLLEQVAKFVYSYECTDYFPVSYTHKLSVAGVWGLEDIDARYATVIKGRVDNYSGHESGFGYQTADATGLIFLRLAGYGQYVLTHNGEKKYVRFYANTFSISDDKIIMEEVKSDTDESGNEGGC